MTIKSSVLRRFGRKTKLQMFNCANDLWVFNQRALMKHLPADKNTGQCEPFLKWHKHSSTLGGVDIWSNPVLRALPPFRQPPHNPSRATSRVATLRLLENPHFIAQQMCDLFKLLLLFKLYLYLLSILKNRTGPSTHLYFQYKYLLSTLLQ